MIWGGWFTERELSSRRESEGFWVDILWGRHVESPLGRGPMVSRLGWPEARVLAAAKPREGFLVKGSGDLAWGLEISDIMFVLFLQN